MHLGGASAEVAERTRHAAEVHTVGLLLQMEEKRLDQSLPAAQHSGKGGGRDASMAAREEQILRGLLSGVADLEPCIEIILQRHDWYDGSGSLNGRKGDDIIEEARVLAVADAFVDLATPKSHRAPVTLNEVLQRLHDQAGSQFDPRYVEALTAAVLDEEERWGAAAPRSPTTRSRKGWTCSRVRVGESTVDVACLTSMAGSSHRIPRTGPSQTRRRGQGMTAVRRNSSAAYSGKRTPPDDHP